MAIVGRFSELYIDQSLTKKFPIETLLEVIVSSAKSLGEVESVISRSVSVRNFLLRIDLCEVTICGEPHFEFSGQTWAF